METKELPLHELFALIRFPARTPFRINDRLTSIQDGLYAELQAQNAVQEIRAAPAENDNDYALLRTEQPPFRFIVNIRRDSCAVRFIALERSQLAAAARIAHVVLNETDSALVPPFFLATAISAQTVVYLRGTNPTVFAKQLLGMAAFEEHMPLAALPLRGNGGELEHFGRGDLKISYQLKDGRSAFVTVECPANLSHHTAWLRLELVHPEGATPPKVDVLRDEYFDRFRRELEGPFDEFTQRLLPPDLVDYEETRRVLGALAVEARPEGDLEALPPRRRARGR